MREQCGLITRAEARHLGMSDDQIRWRLRSGQWDEVYKGVFGSATIDVTPEQRLLAAVLAAGAGAIASFESAAWLWGLRDRPPERPTITVQAERRPRVRGVVVHRSSDLGPDDVHYCRGVRCASPMRAIVDLAPLVDEDELDAMVDRLLASKRGTVATLEGEISRRSGRGKRGARILDRSLRRRALIGAPAPSVLESKADRLFRSAGIRPLGSEVKTGDGWYRVDYVVACNVIVEVSGYAYHWSPEQHRRDEQRRNRLTLAGNVVLVYTWRDIADASLRVIEEVSEAIRSAAVDPSLDERSPKLG